MLTVYSLRGVSLKVKNTPDMSSYYTKREVEELVAKETHKLNVLIDDLYDEISYLENKIEQLEKPTTPEVLLFILDKGLLNTMILG